MQQAEKRGWICFEPIGCSLGFGWAVHGVSGLNLGIFYFKNAATNFTEEGLAGLRTKSDRIEGWLSCIRRKSNILGGAEYS